MGRDKAMLRLAGRTLLGRAVDTLRAVPSLRDSTGRVVVTVVGERAQLEGADRAIPDRYPGCGPVGGMEAALRDLEDNIEDEGGTEWAFFLPVDMPFLPAPLIEALLGEWNKATLRGAKVCCVEVDGRPQPLVSMVSGTALPVLREALTAGLLKVTPVLQYAAGVMASYSRGGIGYSRSALHVTSIDLDGSGPDVAGWRIPAKQERLKHHWFSNLNDEKEFRLAETFVSSLGSS
jgi:molybdopterin-guanine dinucleotide biosynthesis protein A